MTERWDPTDIERGWRDALALLGEFVPSVDEVAETFRSEVFAANVTNDDARLEALVAEALDAAHQGREIAAIFEDFAVAVVHRTNSTPTWSHPYPLPLRAASWSENDATCGGFRPPQWS